MTTNRGTILIVDDEEVIRKLLRKKLSGEGYGCQEASSADQALDIMKSDTVELAILDIKMPGKSGIDFLSEMKARYPDTAVIMATSVVDSNIAVRCMKEGTYDYLTKPFNLDEVTLSVRRALEKRRLELENRGYQQHLEGKVKKQAEKIRSSFLNAIASLAYALEAKDKYTSGHSQRVTRIAVAIAQEMGMSPEDVNRIQIAGLVHDIGKLGIREAILNKPGELSKEEFGSIRSEIGL